MSKTRSLVAIIIFLLITNVVMLLFFVFSGKPPVKRESAGHEQGSSMYNSLQHEVGFSTAQLDRYQLLRKQQRETVKPLFGELRTAKKDFYNLLYTSTVSDSLIVADADSIAQKQKRLDLQMFGYFKSIRNICTPDQLQKFDSIINKAVIRMIAGPGRSGKDNPKQKIK